MEEDEGDYIDEPQFQQSIHAFKQAGLAPLGLGTLDVGGYFGIAKKFDAKGHFKETVNAIAQQLREDGFRLSNDDITQLIENVEKLNNPQYKNPTAYLLGYVASSGGRVIDKKTVNNVFNNLLKTVSDKSVKNEDVLRYARLWYNLVRE
jgi:hypothetical protein